MDEHFMSPLLSAKARRAAKLKAEADNCVALSVRSDAAYAGALLDEAIMLNRRARQLKGR